MKTGLAAGLSAALLVASTTLSGAAPLSPASVAPSAASTQNSNIVDVRWRGHHHGHRHHRHHWHRHGWRHHHGWGPAFGGFAAGALIGSAIASSNARANNDAVAYCMNRFKSYDPASGTYLGYDGDRHPCP